MKLEKLLLSSSRRMSAHAKFCLLTLLILMGLTIGLWSTRQAPVQQTSGNAGTPTVRGDANAQYCSHVAVGFDPQISMQQLARILRAEDASIVYGPDEFGDYHLRFARGISPQQGIQSLRARAQVRQATAHRECQ